VGEVVHFEGTGSCD